MRCFVEKRRSEKRKESKSQWDKKRFIYIFIYCASLIAKFSNSTILVCSRFLYAIWIYSSRGLLLLCIMSVYYSRSYSLSCVLYLQQFFFSLQNNNNFFRCCCVHFRRYFHVFFSDNENVPTNCRVFHAFYFVYLLFCFCSPCDIGDV